MAEYQTGGHRVRIQRTVNAPVSKVYAAWLEPKQLNRWFTNKARVDPKIGGRYSNGDHDTGEFLELKPNRVVKFSWENPSACPGTVVTVRFKSAGRNKCELELTHSRLGGPEKGMDEMTGGWSWALDSLKSWLETGKGIKHDDWMAQRKGG
jgi:uncharacterized protein YndB with AHSA1/START domain